MIDTNLLVYSTVIGNPWYDEARQWLADLQAGGTRLCVSTQIAREYFVVLTRGKVFTHTFTPDEVLTTFSALQSSLTLFSESLQTFDHLCDLMRRYDVRGKTIHDANIVATMLTHHIPRLATYNQDDFKRFPEITLEPLPSGSTRSLP